MRAWQLEEFGLENLRPAERTTPKPGPGEILVKVSAVSLNYRDKAIVDGAYDPEKMPKNLIPVNDTAGVVAGIGPGVTDWKVGDRVLSHLYSHWLDGAPARDEPDWQLGGPVDGGLAEYMILEADSAVPTPGNLTDEQAATLPIAALTAWFSLVDYGNLQPGQTVLVQGTGGVSLFAVQIATALGARVIATSSSDEKLQKVAALGADGLINYRTTPKIVQFDQLGGAEVLTLRDVETREPGANEPRIRVEAIVPEPGRDPVPRGRLLLPARLPLHARLRSRRDRRGDR